MAYKRKTVDRWKFDAVLIVLASTLLVGMINGIHTAFAVDPLVWPIPAYDARLIEIEKEVEVIREVPVNCQTEKCEILAYIVEKFGDDAADAITMINKCENHAFDPEVTNHNSNGTIDRGVFQINSVHGGEELFEWKTNIDKAYDIYQAQGWSPWTCSYVVGVRSYWQ